MKYLFIQNLIAPYRTSLFNKLYEMGLDFEVLYMCELEKDRLSWSVEYSSMHFPFQVLQGYYKDAHGMQIHWDPKIIKYVKENPDAKVILGGSWNFLDIIAICFLKRIKVIKNELLFWAEANYKTLGARKQNKFRDILRNFIYHSGDGRFIVPGQMGVETFKRWGVKVNKFLFLPNVIEEEKFKDIMLYEKKQHDMPIFVIPARLEERIKGQMNFFNAIGLDNIRKAQFLLLGRGSDESILEDYIKSNHLEEHIVLKGNLDMKQMVESYKQADVCVLPSFTDASPLSLVEAICCSLPLLISNYCGNHFETLVEGLNGYSFSPYNPEEIRAAFEALVDRRDEWQKMGVESRKLFEHNFRQSVVLERFISQLNNY